MKSIASSRRLAMIAALAAVVPLAAHADAVKAGRYYEDGLARFEAGDAAGAIIQLKNALQQNRDMLAAHLLLARAHLAEGELVPAEAAFREALRLGVSRAEVAVPLARIHLQQGRPAAVIDTVAVDGLPAAVRVELLTLRGTAFATLQRPADAERSFAEARALDPGSPLPLVAEVPVLLASGRLDQARERAEQAVRLAPALGAAFNAVSKVLFTIFRVLFFFSFFPGSTDCPCSPLFNSSIIYLLLS